MGVRVYLRTFALIAALLAAYCAWSARGAVTPKQYLAPAETTPVCMPLRLIGLREARRQEGAPPANRRFAETEASDRNARAPALTAVRGESRGLGLLALRAASTSQPHDLRGLIR